ncbi:MULTISPECIES: hypothetical protein [Halomonas]|uniref:hypothetical protein n=1 Tax=Halomonas TaxID=2745 RepID=UPI001C96714D|nr:MULTISPECIES: hypothetical protein [Halomonas]MBY6208749.1 hypothetical protein [Halomonas sp. DP3Y7-2]MBY6227219.1 hypothetical protein [Halomonas sp. DP3Y7-1]MCA0915031.1 hypothetical protein [Halomonas denitrificans]
MKKVIAMADKTYGEFPRAAYVETDPKTGDEMSFSGETLVINEVTPTPNILGYDFIVSLSKRSDP